jgi:hypothetical protein
MWHKRAAESIYKLIRQMSNIVEVVKLKRRHVARIAKERN